MLAYMPIQQFAGEDHEAFFGTECICTIEMVGSK